MVHTENMKDAITKNLNEVFNFDGRLSDFLLLREENSNE